MKSFIIALITSLTVSIATPLIMDYMHEKELRRVHIMCIVPETGMIDPDCVRNWMK